MRTLAGGVAAAVLPPSCAAALLQRRSSAFERAKVVGPVNRNCDQRSNVTDVKKRTVSIKHQICFGLYKMVIMIAKTSLKIIWQ